MGTEDQIDQALSDQLEAGGLTRHRVGDVEMQFADPEKLLKAKKLARELDSVNSGTSFYTGDPE